MTRKRLAYLPYLAVALITCLCISCSKDDDDESPVQTVTLTEDNKVERGYSDGSLHYYLSTPKSGEPYITIKGEDESIETLSIPQYVLLNEELYPVTHIATDAFRGYRNLTSVNIPNSVQIIGQGAFENCKSLSVVTIGTGVQDISNAAFAGCPLREIYIKCQTPPNIIATTTSSYSGGVHYFSSQTFSEQSYNNATLYVPNGLWSKYAYHYQWSNFQHIEESVEATE